QAEKAQRRIQLIGQQQPGGPDGSGGAIGPRGLGGPGGKGAGARSPQFPGGEFPGMQQREAVQSDEIKFVSLEKLKNETGKWAETNIPVRLVMVTAAFPYKAQLEEYRKKLRLSSVDELLLDQTGMRPEFTGFNVQRRTYGPDGKLIEDWTDLDVETPLKHLLVRAKEREPENPDLQTLGIIVYPNRVVLPRPKLAREQTYPEPKLDTIDKTKEDLTKAMQDQAAPLPAAKTRFEDVDL